MIAGCRSLKLAAALTVAGVVLVAPQVRADEDGLVKYYRKKNNVPPAQKVAVEGVHDSANIKGAKEGSLTLGEGPGAKKIGFVASSDLRWVSFSAPEDITVDPAKAVMAKMDLKNDAFKGGANAKVTIVEYSDFQCPFCKKGYDVIEKEVLAAYGDKVKFHFRHYPLPFHPWAEPGAMATECAQEQKADAYWKLYAAYFENQAAVNPQNVKEKAVEWLKDAGIDMAKWNDCYDNKKTQAKVKAEMAEGAGIGVTGTPAFFINGRMLVGAQPIDKFKAVIDDELANAK
jgi:protein-disulfide isomerase